MFTKQRHPIISTRNKTRSPANSCSPLSYGQPYPAIKICELIIGNSFALAECSWKLWKAESPPCQQSEEDAYHYFFVCKSCEDFLPEVQNMNIHNEKDCESGKLHNKYTTRRERLKSALYLRLKKRTFYKKNLKFLIFFQKMSHSAEKCKGGPFGLY